MSLALMCFLSLETIHARNINTKRPNSLSTMHYRLCKEGKQGKAALGAVMRKQLTVMRAVLITGKPYDPAFKGCGKRGGEAA